MEEMDGFQVLQALDAQEIRLPVIVISADIQDEAVRRVLDYGALAFLKKPVDAEQLHQLLASHRLIDPHTALAERSSDQPLPFREVFAEVVNVGMGRAAALLARVLGVYVQLPIPNVNMLEVGELQMALEDAARGEKLTAVCQGTSAAALPARRC